MRRGSLPNYLSVSVSSTPGPVPRSPGVQGTFPESMHSTEARKSQHLHWRYRILVPAMALALALAMATGQFNLTGAVEARANSWQSAFEFGIEEQACLETHHSQS